MSSFGKLKHVSLRNIWANESNNFTPWLAENISELGKALGMELELKQKEAGVGDFSLDLLVNDLSSNRTVVIENQLTSTDHDHLGKLLTYASGFDASVIVWISESFREEHRQTMDWLNQRTDSDTEFFGVVIEVLQIDDSMPAYNFKPVVFPNEWQKSKKRPPASQVSPKMEAYRSYYQTLIDDLREKHNFTNAQKAPAASWINFATGYTGIAYGMCFALGGKARVELYITFGDAGKNKKLFDLLHSEKVKIESELGESLRWERLNEKQACRISIYREGTIENDQDALTELKNWSIEKLLKFKKTFSPALRKYIPILNSVND